MQRMTGHGLRSGMLLLAVAAGTVAASVAVDDPVGDFCRGPFKSGQMNATLAALRSCGEGVVLLFLLAGIAAASGPRRLACALVLAGTLLAVGVVDGVKTLTNRPRPDQRDVADELRGTRANSSFPSSHVAVAFANAAGLTRMFPAVAPVAYLAAVGTAISRIHDGRHHLSDCVAGAWLGWLAVRMVFGMVACLDRRWPRPTTNDAKPVADVGPRRAA